MRDAVDRLTPLGVMVLALLREGDMHPYEILRLLRQRHHDRLVTITNGTLYHTVGRLEKAELLGEVGVDREGNRPERTTYTLTDAGRVIVSEWVRRELSRIDRTTEFRVALAEAHNLDRLEVAELLRRRRDALGDTHQAYLRGREKARTIDTPEQFLIEVEVRREERSARPLPVGVLPLEQLGAEAFGGDPGAGRLPDLAWRTRHVTLGLPAQRRV